MKKIFIIIGLIFSSILVNGQDRSEQKPIKFDKDEMLRLVNEARMEKRRCGGKRHQATHPLEWNEKLAAAAQKHADDMGDNDFFDHTGSDGSTIVIRVEREDYLWRAVGENVAMGPRSVAVAVKGWLDSPGHCSNMMNPDFTELGAALSKDRKYWVQVFAAPR